MAERTVKVNIVAQATGYVSGMDAAAKATREVGSEAEKLAQKAQGFQALGRAGVAVGVAILGIGAAALSTGIKYNTLQQTSRAALKTILGGAEAANAQMDKLDEFARNSPFAKQTFIQAQQQMLAFGVETKKVIPYLDAVQNAVSAAGGSNDDIAGIVATMSKIQSSSKLTAQDLNEFGNRGVNAAELIGSQMGKTGAQIRQEITSGSLDATKALDALTAGMSEKFAGASANVKQTFEGSIDRVKAAWRDFSSELAKPLVDPNGGGALVDLLNWTADMMRGFQGLPEPIKATTAVITGLIGVVALGGGTALLAAAKWAVLKGQLEAVGITSVKTKGALKSVGVAAVALIALGLAHEARKWVDGLTGATKSADEFEKSLNKVSDAGKTVEDALKAGALVDLGGKSRQNLDALSTELGQFTADLENSWVGTVAKVGTLGLFDTTLGNAKKNIGELDKALAGLVTGGKTKQAAAAWGELVSQTDGSWAAIDKLKKLFPEYAAALDVAEVATVDNSGALAELDGAAEGAGDQVSDLAAIIRGFGSTTLSARDAERQFQSAIDDATEAFAENGATLDVTTEAGRQNEAALDGIAKAALESAAAIYEQTGSQAESTTAINAGRDALVEQLEKYGITGQAAQEYINNLGLIPSNIDTAVKLNTAQASADLANWMRLASGNTVRIAMGAGGSGGMTRKDGGAIGYAGGGHIRGFGGPRQDNIPIMASSGEHMLDVGDVKRMGGQAAVYRFRESLAGMQSAPMGYQNVGGSNTGTQIGQVTITAPAIETQNPEVYGTIIGREFARRLAG